MTDNGVTDETITYAEAEIVFSGSVPVELRAGLLESLESLDGDVIFGLTTLLSEEALSKDWSTGAEDAAWEDL